LYNFLSFRIGGWFLIPMLLMLNFLSMMLELALLQQAGWGFNPLVVVYTVGIAFGANKVPVLLLMPVIVFADIGTDVGTDGGTGCVDDGDAGNDTGEDDDNTFSTYVSPKC
jgi:hypothetical protein